MLGGRCLSGSIASSTGRGSCPASRQPMGRTAMRVHGPNRLTRVTAIHDKNDELLPITPGFFTLDNPFNREPDYEDPDWFEKVTDWDEFWNHTRWDLENEDNDDEYDVSGAPTRSVDRAYQMLAAFKQIEGRADVSNLVAAQSRRQHIGVYDDPPVDPETQPELPPWDLNDWRAMAEKQRRKELLDIEWRNRQAKVGRLPYPHKDVTRDVRMRAFDYLGETFDWSPEEMYGLITIQGTACRPEDHKAYVENPLAVVDYVNVMGVTHIEETEDFLARIGHLGTPSEMEMLSEQEIEDLLENSPVPQSAALILEPTLRALEAQQAEEERRAAGNTWMGDE